VFALVLISTEFIIASDIFPSWLSAQIDGITVDHLCGFGRNRSTADHVMSVGQILEKKQWAVHQLFIQFNTVCRLYRLGKTLYNILTKRRISMKLLSLIKSCVDEMFREVRTDRRT
jgi:hypothetical protein